MDRSTLSIRTTVRPVSGSEVAMLHEAQTETSLGSGLPLRLLQDSLAAGRPLRLLIAEDSPEDTKLVVDTLRGAGYSVTFQAVDSPELLQDQLRRVDYDLVLSGHTLRSGTGMDALRIVRQANPYTPFIVATPSLGDETAVEYIKRGASDYVLKDRLDRLPVAVDHALTEKAHRQETARLHEELASSKRDWELTFNTVPDPVLIFDQQCRIRRANLAASHLLGLCGPELIGRFCHDVLHAPAVAPSGCTHQQVLATGVAQRYDDSESHLGRTFDVINSPLKDPESVVIGCIQTLHDITERNRTERALRDGEERYRLLFQANPQPTFVYDANSLEYLAVNDAAVRHYGYSTDEFLSMTIKDVRLPEDAPRLLAVTSAHALANYQAAMAASLEIGHWRHRKKNGCLIDVDITTHHLEFAGKNAVLAIATDVTDKLRLEQELRQAQKMEAVGRLAGGVAHDFNNLMGIVLGYSDLLALDTTLSEQARHRLEEIKKAGERAAAVTHQLLAFSRKQVFETRIIDLNRLVTNTTGLLERLLGENVALATEFDVELGMVKADATQLEQIIMNLAVNARDAMPDGGKLTIHTANTELDAAYGEGDTHVPSGDYVMLEVSDNGTGMDAETQSQIFEPFFTTKETDHGTGLGLATVYGIVKQSGGYISVYSEVGIGTTFKIYLPRVQGVADGLVSSSLPATIERGSETILLVEDDAALRTLDRELLEELGYRVVEASKGSEAIVVSGRYSGSIHLLMSDVIMPGMSGKQLADELLRSHPNTKVLYVSGYTNNVIQHVLSNPGAPFLQKPFARETLSKKLREILGPMPEPSPASVLVGLNG